jgi:hypothetical protein
VNRTGDCLARRPGRADSLRAESARGQAHLRRTRTRVRHRRESQRNSPEEHSQPSKTAGSVGTTAAIVHRRTPAYSTVVGLLSRLSERLFERKETMNAKFREQLKQLRLSVLMKTLEVRLQEAKSSKLDYAEFLELILEDEMVVRSDR